MRIRRKIAGAAIAVALLAGAAVAVLRFPQPLFAWSVAVGNLTLYSDTPFDPAAGRTLLGLARAKLLASPVFSTAERHRVFICHTSWRKWLFLNYQYPRGAGGVNYYPITTNVFLRDGVIAENRMLTRAGRPVPGERTLDYFIAHEIAHSLAARVAGWSGNHGLAEWVREGYPEYVARRGSFDYEETRRALVAGTLERKQPGKAPPYKRYCLLVACLIERGHWTVRDVMRTTVTETEVERAIRTGERIPPK